MDPTCCLLWHYHGLSIRRIQHCRRVRIILFSAVLLSIDGINSNAHSHHSFLSCFIDCRQPKFQCTCNSTSVFISIRKLSRSTILSTYGEGSWVCYQHSKIFFWVYYQSTIPQSTIVPTTLALVKFLLGLCSFIHLSLIIFFF